jgi:solute carrier family 25 protein 33/36
VIETIALILRQAVVCGLESIKAENRQNRTMSVAKSSPAEPQVAHVHPPAWAHFVAGGTGAMVGGVLTCPLEVVKTRLQGTYNKEGLANAQHRFGTRTMRALTHLHSEGGVSALYRGMVPHLVGVVPARALYFGTFSSAKRELVKRFDLDPHGMLLTWLGGVAAGNSSSSLHYSLFINCQLVFPK